MTLTEIAKKHNLSLILMHGSQVTGKIHAKSDLDIAVMQKSDKKNLDLIGLYADLGSYFKINNVDITNITHPNPLLGIAVARKSKLLFGLNEDYEDFCRKAFFRYNDYYPYLKMESDFVKERIEEYA
jgi:hypothetical protein